MSERLRKDPERVRRALYALFGRVRSTPPPILSRARLRGGSAAAGPSRRWAPRSGRPAHAAFTGRPGVDAPHFCDRRGRGGREGTKASAEAQSRGCARACARRWSGPTPLESSSSQAWRSVSCPRAALMSICSGLRPSGASGSKSAAITAMWSGVRPRASFVLQK
eukprot:3032656-Prymnesium_polylepis.1